MPSIGKKKKYPIHQSPLFKIGSHKKLAILLKTDVKFLRLLSRNQDKNYRVWTEKKDESDKSRIIEAPHPRLKRIQGRISALLSLIEPPQFLTCPVKGRSYVSNAKIHVGARQIVTLDVSKYFPSTTWRRVYWFFSKRLLINPDISWTLASILTLNGHLPTGSPSSPILSYYAHEDIWLKVMEIADLSNIKLSLYMDDLSVSGESVPEHVIWTIKSTINSSGLRLNAKKERRYQNGFGVVTGILVTPSGIRPKKSSHLRLKTIRDEAAAPAINELEKIKLRKRIAGLEVQHRQITQRKTEEN